MTVHTTALSKPGPRTGLALAFVALLAGCSADTDELRQWMAQERREARSNVPPLTPPKKFNPAPYSAGQAVEPFSNQKLSVAIKQEARAPNSLLAAELNRRREPLESFPLDSMTMVGSVVKQGVQHALLRVDNLLYQVKVGDYLGQNYGRIMRITETEVTLRELVQDAAGDTVERPATLQLQERPR